MGNVVDQRYLVVDIGKRLDVDRRVSSVECHNVLSSNLEATSQHFRKGHSIVVMRTRQIDTACP